MHREFAERLHNRPGLCTGRRRLLSEAEHRAQQSLPPSGARASASAEPEQALTLNKSVARFAPEGLESKRNYLNASARRGAARLWQPI